jgi:hypothetical protein
MTQRRMDMRHQPRTRSSRAASLTEFRIHFTSQLTGARLASPDDPLTPPQYRPAAPPPEEQAGPAEPTSPVDFWQTDVGQELAVDRGLIESVLAGLTRGVERLRTEQAQRLEQVQRVAIELAMTIATRLLHRSVTDGEFPVEAKVRDMVAKLEGDAPVSVRLNPADLELLEARLGGEPLLAGATDPRLIPDSTLARGDCQVDGKEGMLFSNVERELQQIRDDLLRSLGHARP